jgi:hypothetical protein
MCRIAISVRRERRCLGGHRRLTRRHVHRRAERGCNHAFPHRRVANRRHILVGLAQGLEYRDGIVEICGPCIVDIGRGGGRRL